MATSRLGRKPELVAVVDTNVLLAIYSIHDLSRAASAARAGGGSGAATSALEDRRLKAMYSLLLATYFHERGAFTVSLDGEFSRTMLDRVDPTGSSFDRAYTTAFLHGVSDAVLSGWRRAVRPGTDALRGNQADAELIRFSAASKVPLITYEGKPEGGPAVWGSGDKMLQCVPHATTPEDFLASRRVALRPLKRMFRRRSAKALRRSTFRNIVNGFDGGWYRVSDLVELSLEYIFTGTMPPLPASQPAPHAIEPKDAQ